MGQSGYTTCAIPDGLARRVEAVLEDPFFGYRSRGEFVVDAVRRLLQECEAQQTRDAGGDILRHRP